MTQALWPFSLKNKSIFDVVVGIYFGIKFIKGSILHLFVIKILTLVFYPHRILP